MASFLDKAGLTKFWELIKQYLSSSHYINDELLPTFDNRLDEKLRDNTYNILDIVRYIPLPASDNIIFNYHSDIKRYSASRKGSDPYVRVLLKYYQKKLLLKYIKDRDTSIDLLELLRLSLPEDNSEMYLGRLPEHEIYPSNDKIYSRISFDIYLVHKEISSDLLYSGYVLKLIPVSVSNGYTLNFISGEDMIRYLGYYNRKLNSNRYYNINLVTDSPFDFRNYSNYGGQDSMSISHLVKLSNRNDITYTIRYPRYLNGMLTFLKGNEDGSELELADKTPEVVDGTYNDVVLTRDMSLFMYGDINISKSDFPISEPVEFTIFSTQDTTGKLLTLSGNIYMIYGLLNTYDISNNKEIKSLDTRYFKLFNSQYIGNIIFNDNLFIPFDPLNKYLLLYKEMFNNTGIYTATAGIHFIGNNPYITPNMDRKGIFNNFTKAYRNCNRLTKLYIYIYLEGDLSLDSNLKDYHIENAVHSISEMVEGSNYLSDIYLIPATNFELSTSELNKFSNLMNHVIGYLKRYNSNFNIEIKSRFE
nr:MAG TPA: hypothetical protein [Caudoviricetes sp.]